MARGVRRIFTLKVAAQQIGVAPITLKRWLLDGKVAEVARDRNGWRAFSTADIARIKRYAITLRDPEGQ
jgi:predicted site-specific integrase-resolvase